MRRRGEADDADLELDADTSVDSVDSVTDSIPDADGAALDACEMDSCLSSIRLDWSRMWADTVSLAWAVVMFDEATTLRMGKDIIFGDDEDDRESKRIRIGRRSEMHANRRGRLEWDEYIGVREPAIVCIARVISFV